MAFDEAHDNIKNSGKRLDVGPKTAKIRQGFTHRNTEMDDLTDLDWSRSNPTPSQKSSSANYYPSLRPTPPISGSSSPAFQPPFNALKPPNGGPSRSNNSTPANDSFANLVSFKNAQSTANLSLEEQQRQLHQQKTQQHKQLNIPGAAVPDGDNTFWEQLGSGRSTPNAVTSPPGYTATSEYGGHKVSARINKPFEGTIGASRHTNTQKGTPAEEDLLAGFGGTATPLESGSKSSETAGPIPSDRHGPGATKQVARITGQNAQDFDDDPFGLGTTNGKQEIVERHNTGEAIDDDDVLGLLGRPVSEFQHKSTPDLQTAVKANGKASHPQDQALAELVEMGFPLERSREALESTESGIDVQAAVGWILNQAHQDSRKKTQTSQGVGDNLQSKKGRRKSSEHQPKSSTPAWMRQEGALQDSPRQNGRLPIQGEKDPSKIASELGNNIFKTANSLWKTGTKKLNQAVAELNADGDTSQPKWMREAKPVVEGHRRSSQRHPSKADDLDKKAVEAIQQAKSKHSEVDVTVEALMLESADARPARKPPPRPKTGGSAMSEDSLRRQSPVAATKPDSQDAPRSRSMQQAQLGDPPSRLTKQAVEEQASEAYISPARRKRTTPKPTAEHRMPSPEPDLLFGASGESKSYRPTPISQSRPPATTRSPAANPLPTRPPFPKRSIPPLSSSALQNFHKFRLAGIKAFKRGDYAEATAHYTSALSTLPQIHPLTIPMLTNRALSHSKTGDPKASIADATTALHLIGPSRGVSENIDFSDGVPKDMYLFWGKAVMRKAEASEQLERWSDALESWKLCVEAGVGGAISIAGRNRCEKAANPSTRNLPPARKPAPKSKPRTTALDDLSGRPAATSVQSAEAVSRLRAANLEAERVDDEKFALSDSVSERIQSWRAGKEGNLRALLASLETVLWEGAGWKKIGMGELILPGKVKIQYMKGIAKVHPDKVCINSGLG